MRKQPIDPSRREWFGGDAKSFILFILIILECPNDLRRHPTRSGVVNLERGQIIYTRGKFAKEVGMNPRSIDRKVKELESKYGVVRIYPHKSYSIISIVNYESIISMRSGDDQDKSLELHKKNKKMSSSNDKENTGDKNEVGKNENDNVQNLSTICQEFVQVIATIIEDKNKEIRENITVIYTNGDQVAPVDQEIPGKSTISLIQDSEGLFSPPPTPSPPKKEKKEYKLKEITLEINEMMRVIVTEYNCGLMIGDKEENRIACTNIIRKLQKIPNVAQGKTKPHEVVSIMLSSIQGSQYHAHRGASPMAVLENLSKLYQITRTKHMTTESGSQTGAIVG